MGQQTTIFVFEARDKNLGATIVQTTEHLSRLNKEFKKTEEGTEDYKDLSIAIAQTKEQLKKLNEQQKLVNKEFEASKVPKDSLAGLRIEYSKLTQSIAALSAEERKSQFGKSLISNASKVKREIDGIEQSFGRFTGNVGNYRSAFNNLAPVVGKVGFAIGGLFAALQGGSAIVQATRDTEKFFAVLKNAVGSELGARQIFEELQNFAATTPFQLNELVGAFTKLENRNFNPTIEQLRTMGDIASSSGKSIDQFVEAILDAQTGQFERLKEFGIVARKSGDELKLSFRGQTQTIANTSEEITKYLLELGKLPGIQGAASAVAETLDGSISNLSDNMTRLYATIGSGGGILKGAVDTFNSLVGAVNDLLDVPLSEELRSQQTEFNALIGVLQDTTASETEKAAVMKILKAEYPGYLKYVNDDTEGQLDLAASLEAGNKQFEARILLQSTEEKRIELTKRKLAAEQELTKELVKQKSLTAKESADLAFQGKETTTTRGDVSERNIADLRREIAGVNTEIDDLLKTADETAIRTIGKTIAELRAELLPSKTATEEETVIGGANKEAKALEGSLRFLREEISRLQDKIENEPGDSKFLEQLIKDLDAAKKKLNDAEKAFLQTSFRAKFGRDLTAPSTDTGDQPSIEVIPELQSDAKPTLKEQADQLAKETEDALQAVEFPVEIKMSDEERAAWEKLQEERQKGAEDLFALQEKLADEAAANEKKRKEDLKQAAINAAENIASSVFQIQQNRINREEAIAIQALENEFNRKIEKASGNSKKQAQLEAQLSKKREQIEKESAQKRKKVAKQEAIIQGALSTVEALPNLVLAAFTAAAVIAQLAVIDSTEFAGGGFTNDRKRRPNGVKLSQPKNPTLQNFLQMQTPAGFTGFGIAPPDKTGRRPAGAYMKGNTMIVYHEKEYIAPASQVERHPELFQALEKERVRSGRSFAKGGYTGSESSEYIAPASQVSRFPHIFKALDGELMNGGYLERYPKLNDIIHRATPGRMSYSFALGGFTAAPPPVDVQRQQEMKVTATLSNEQFNLLVSTLAREVSSETGKQVRTGVALGLNDNNRTQERLSALEEQRTI